MTMQTGRQRRRVRDWKRHVPAFVTAAVRRYLETEALGRLQAKTLGQIIESLDIEAFSDRRRQVRRAIVILIREEKVPIGSDTSGYYVCCDIEDVEHAERDAMSRIKHLSRRRVKLRAAFHERHGGQLSLDDYQDMAVAMLAKDVEDDGDE